MSREAKTTFSHSISTERHTMDRFREFNSWATAFGQVRQLYLHKRRRLLCLIARSDIRQRQFLETHLVCLEQIDELEALCQETIFASKFVVMDMETNEETSSTNQTLLKAVTLVYMKDGESFTELDVPELEFS